MARLSIELPAALAEQIRQEAAIAVPRECCGLVEGLRDGERFRATALHPARNLAADADRFDIDPRDHLAAARAARANGSSRSSAAIIPILAARRTLQVRDRRGRGAKRISIWLIRSRRGTLAADSFTCVAILWARIRAEYIVGIAAEAGRHFNSTVITRRIDDVDHMPGLVCDLDAAMVQRAAMEQFFAHDLAQRIDGFPAGGLDIAKILALARRRGVQIAALRGLVEEIAGHGVTRLL